MRSGATGTYWGRNAFKLNHEYVGVTVLVLAIFGLFGKRRRGLRWFMAGLSVLWLLFALGTHTPIWRIFYEVVPGISLFRVPSLSAFLVSFGVTTLLALGVDDLVSESPSGAPSRERRAGARCSASRVSSWSGFCSSRRGRSGGSGPP